MSGWAIGLIPRLEITASPPLSLEYPSEYCDPKAQGELQVPRRRVYAISSGYWEASAVSGAGQGKDSPQPLL